MLPMGLWLPWSQDMDKVMIGACGHFNGLELPAAPTLLLELPGSWHSQAKQQQQAAWGW